jgi:SHS family lactate transporter-like MFS transporter
MEFLGHFRRLTPVQRNTFTACFLGWSLDAFDFFILTFCVSAIATQFQAKVSAVAEAIFWTLAMRPVGAFLFGMMADRFGRRPTLMVDIIAYSVFELSSAFAPSLKLFLITRALFGIAMGGEWGVGAALAFETLPAEGRGFFSGLLQEGYAVGYLMAALGLRDGVPYRRLAGNVCDRGAAGISGDLHSHQGGRIAGVVAGARHGQKPRAAWARTF